MDKIPILTALVPFIPYLLLFIALIYLLNKLTTEGPEEKLKEALSDVETFDPHREEKLMGVLMIGIIAVVIITGGLRK